MAKRKSPTGRIGNESEPNIQRLPYASSSERADQVRTMNFLSSLPAREVRASYTYQTFAKEHDPAFIRRMESDTKLKLFIMVGEEVEAWTGLGKKRTYVLYHTRKEVESKDRLETTVTMTVVIQEVLLDVV